MSYDLQGVDLPRLTGLPLALFASAVESGLLRPLLLPKILRDAGVEKLRALTLDEVPTFLPLSRDLRAAGQAPLQALDDLVRAPAPALPLHRVRDYAEAYRSGRTTPTRVAEALLAAIEATRVSAQPLGAVVACHADEVRREAAASTARWAAGAPKSVLDGVPVGVKDELDQAGYPTTVGTRVLGHTPAAHDATVVARLRAAGALLFGKLNMNEIGINPDGGNMHHGLVRNPHDLSRDTGGSSSGSAAAVAAGLCPIAIGADGGGSVRIPAALCGVSGLKATFGRISEHGAAPLCWSVAHVGPLAASIEDVALAYAVVAGADPHDALSGAQPPPSLEGLGRTSLDGLRLGVYRPWFDHAEPAVVQRCRAGLDILVRAGAQVVDIELPGLDAIRTAHALTILTEMATAMSRLGAPHSSYALPTRVNLALGRAFASTDYVRAQQVRTRLLTMLERAYERVDLIVTPTTARTAPPIPVSDARAGWSDLSSVTEVMRYAFVGNLSGYPAISVPVGADEAGLPVGLQLMARPWAEHLLLSTAAVVERERPPSRAKLWFDLLA